MAILYRHDYYDNDPLAIAAFGFTPASLGRLSHPTRFPSPIAFLVCWPLVNAQLFILALSWPWLLLGYHQYKVMIGEEGPGSKVLSNGGAPEGGVKHGGGLQLLATRQWHCPLLFP